MCVWVCVCGGGVCMCMYVFSYVQCAFLCVGIYINLVCLMYTDMVSVYLCECVHLSCHLSHHSPSLVVSL